MNEFLPPLGMNGLVAQRTYWFVTCRCLVRINGSALKRGNDWNIDDSRMGPMLMHWRSDGGASHKGRGQRGLQRRRAKIKREMAEEAFILTTSCCPHYASALRLSDLKHLIIWIVCDRKGICNAALECIRMTVKMFRLSLMIPRILLIWNILYIFLTSSDTTLCHRPQCSKPNSDSDKSHGADHLVRYVSTSAWLLQAHHSAHYYPAATYLTINNALPTTHALHAPHPTLAYNHAFTWVHELGGGHFQSLRPGRCHCWRRYAHSSWVQILQTCIDEFGRTPSWTTGKATPVTDGVLQGQWSTGDYKSPENCYEAGQGWMHSYAVQGVTDVTLRDIWKQRYSPLLRVCWISLGGE
jgi:hypothetical protein